VNTLFKALSALIAIHFVYDITRSNVQIPTVLERLLFVPKGPLELTPTAVGTIACNIDL